MGSSLAQSTASLQVSWELAKECFHNPDQQTSALNKKLHAVFKLCTVSGRDTQVISTRNFYIFDLLVLSVFIFVLILKSLFNSPDITRCLLNTVIYLRG